MALLDQTSTLAPIREKIIEIAGKFGTPYSGADAASIRGEHRP